MVSHTRALSLKTLANGIPALLILAMVGGMDWASALAVTLLITAVAYVVGDLLILPNYGNLVASIADAGLVLMVLWVLRAMGAEIASAALLWLPLALLAVEGLFYHPYLKRLAGLDALGPAPAGRQRR